MAKIQKPLSKQQIKELEELFTSKHTYWLPFQKSKLK